MLKFGFEHSLYIFDEYLTQFCYAVYNSDSVVQTLWFVSADKTKSIRSTYSWFQLNLALSMVEVTVLLAVQKH